MNTRHFSILIIIFCLIGEHLFADQICLNGTWEVGINRIYTKKMTIPGLTSDPARMNDTTLWLKKDIRLPGGDWTHATLILKGALFSPAVYINGEKVSQKNGGMAPTFHLLNHRAVRPGNDLTLELALKSLKDIDESDASYVPRISFSKHTANSASHVSFHSLI